MHHESLKDLLARLDRERQEADRLYNDALTAVDRAIERMPELPHPPPPYDEAQITPLNERWNILPAGPPAIDGSLKGRLRGLIWRMVGPSLEQQRAFNSAVVDHLNRNVGAQRDAHAALSAVIEAMRQHLEASLRFQAHLLGYLQTITLYVDTKDRSEGGGVQVLNATVSALTDDWLKRWESLAAREQRFDARHRALTQLHEELKERVALAQQGAVALKREVQKLVGSLPGRPEPQGPIGPEGPTARHVPDLDSFKYVAFEDRFRGSADQIRTRLADYVPRFAGCRDVLDVGCGRGEFLDLLRQSGIDARGIDLNAAMVEECLARGLRAEHADALSYLESLPDASLGGLIAVQVVEHLEPSYLVRLLEAAFQKLRPGAPMVLETINPACWVAFFESYVRDITHRWPLHPDTLRYLVQATGFASADIEWRAPVPFADKLQRVALAPPQPGTETDPTMVDLVDAINAHADKLNARLFTFMDYAVVAGR